MGRLPKKPNQKIKLLADSRLLNSVNFFAVRGMSGNHPDVPFSGYYRASAIVVKEEPRTKKRRLATEAGHKFLTDQRSGCLLY
jgi:hypothetical protein